MLAGMLDLQRQLNRKEIKGKAYRKEQFKNFTEKKQQQC
jgi:hypothetical protein